MGGLHEGTITSWGECVGDRSSAGELDEMTLRIGAGPTFLLSS